VVTDEQQDHKARKQGHKANPIIKIRPVTQVTRAHAEDAAEYQSRTDRIERQVSADQDGGDPQWGRNKNEIT